MTKPITPDVILKAKELYEAVSNQPWEKANVLVQQEYLVSSYKSLAHKGKVETTGMIADVTEMISLSKESEDV